ncbi:MAG: VirB4 family type IV secretion/conjugal transfer ATPase [Azoarcus sp.]|jgi:type IV secretion/conjugal transfer VirB4 family ATPase|nr:VirB4 family type IV secretion/conjugal transfer ATPase [Azoarcus sp.]
MSAPELKYAAQMPRERSAARHIPYSAHIAPDTLITRDGDYVRMWRLDGVTHETTDEGDVQRWADELNTLIRAIGSEKVSLWTHIVRRRMSDRLEAEFDNPFCASLNERYYATFDKYKMMANELYLTIVYRPNPSKLGRMFAGGRRTPGEILAERGDHLHALDEISRQVESSLRRYAKDPGEGIERMAAYEAETVGKNGIRCRFRCSRMLEFIHFLLTGVWQPVRLPETALNEYLGNAWVHVGTEQIEIRTPARTRYVQIIDFKDYVASTEPGLLNGLLYEDYEFIITQSFSCLSKREGKARLQRQANQLVTAADASPTQIQQMEVALDDLTQGKFLMGEYHYTLAVFGASTSDTANNVGKAMALVQDLGFIAASVNTATEAGFYAQLPANWAYRPRIALLTSLNFVAFSSFHNFLSGKRDNNPWGQAVMLLKTPSGQPLYFNFHASRLEEDAYDKKLLGNTRIIGMSGTGKTVLMGMLFCQSQKYKKRSPTGYTDVFFDKDRGAEIVVRAVGGRYLALKNGEPTGFNPFQMEPTETNIQFLERLVVRLVTGETDGEKLSASDFERISKAIRSVMAMPREVRRLALVPQNITEPADAARKENSVKKRLARWCSGGPFAWVLDNPADLLDFTTHSSYGIDGTEFLDNPATRTPISMYLLHRMESVIDGRRFIYYMDECWKWVNDEAFAEFAGNKQLTIRKQNGLGVFATQMPSSLLESKIASHLVQQTATEIYLPNPKADHDEYTTGKGGRMGFGLTEAEFEIVRAFEENSRMMLIKQGHRSSVATLSLEGLDAELAVLSGSTDNIELLHKVMREVGSEEPEKWMGAFIGRIAARGNRNRLGTANTEETP